MHTLGRILVHGCQPAAYFLHQHAFSIGIGRICWDSSARLL